MVAQIRTSWTPQAGPGLPFPRPLKAYRGSRLGRLRGGACRAAAGSAGGSQAVQVALRPLRHHEPRGRATACLGFAVHVSSLGPWYLFHGLVHVIRVCGLIRAWCPSRGNHRARLYSGGGDVYSAPDLPGKSRRRNRGHRHRSRNCGHRCRGWL